MTSLPVGNSRTQCICGRVVLETTGKPILSAACYCGDCRNGAREIEALPGASAILDAEGGTELLLFRKDRMRCTQGADLLRDMRLREDSPTRRVVAGCCNTALFLDFEKGHWYSLYRARFMGEAPPLAMRLNMGKRAKELAPDDAVPRYATFAWGFIGKILAARVAMLFGNKMGSE